MEKSYAGLLRAGLAALLAVGLGIVAPYALVDIGVAWQRIVLLSLMLAGALVLITAFVLGIVAQICASRVPTSRNRIESRLLLMSDVFLIAAVGVAAVAGIFSYVLAIIRIAS